MREDLEVGGPRAGRAGLLEVGEEGADGGSDQYSPYTTGYESNKDETRVASGNRILE